MSFGTSVLAFGQRIKSALTTDITPRPDLPAISRFDAQLRPKPTLGGEGAYRPGAEDASALEIDRITDPVIKAALSSAKNGDMRALADINDMITVHARIGGVIEQRVAGTKGLQFGWEAPNDSPRAADILAMAQELLKPTDPPAIKAKETSVMHRLRGGGLAENVFALRSGWEWRGAVEVNQQRMRYDAETREPAFAYNPYDYQGVPLSSFDPGTWIYFPIHEGLQHFGLRGYFRRLLTPWMSGNRTFSSWNYTVGRWGDPPLHLASDDADERAEGKSLGKLGNGVVLTTISTTKVAPIQTAHATGSQGAPHHELLAFTTEDASICLLGATQMVTVGVNQGAQNSAPGHANIRIDILQSDADAYAEAMSTYVAVPLAMLHFGLDAGVDAPRLLPIWKEPVDVGQELDNAKKLDDLGAEIGLDYFHERVGWPRPTQTEETIRGLRATRAPAISNVLPFVPKGKP